MAAVLLSPPHAEGGHQLSPPARKGRRRKEEEQLSLLTLLVTVVRKSLVACRVDDGDEVQSMEISRPINVRHVVHVTFDRFHGFLGLPVELEPEVPRRPPSASASVFGVSTESMQCSYDSRGNSVPTILLLMQRRLYEQGGLLGEGIFRVNAENTQEERVREELNSGVIPEDVDVHCLAGLIKAWFRELPSGVLDPLTPEQVMESQTEEECAQVVKLLPPTESALLDWAVNLMADVAQHEQYNKMNARNIAMVFAPNMTQMADPLTALMYAVQVMNLLKALILRTLKERQEAVPAATVSALTCPSRRSDDEDDGPAKLAIDPAQPGLNPDQSEPVLVEKKIKKNKNKAGSSSRLMNPKKVAGKSTGASLSRKKSKPATSIVSRINPRMERAEAWR
ncbi:rho GTPase-activating protein 5-like [Wolffia australiana]